MTYCVGNANFLPIAISRMNRHREMALKNNRLDHKTYQENFAEINKPLNSVEASMEASRCLFCYDAPCIKACPTGIDVPLFIKQIASGNVRGSAKTIISSNIFGGGCSRVCPVEVLCENACVLTQHNNPIHIALLQRYSTDVAMSRSWKLFSRKSSNGKKVAVIGGGPAGLSCAHKLALEGIDVTVFEKEKAAGGLMTYGVAAYKTTPEFCHQEIDWITSVGGIEIKYDSAIQGLEAFRNIREKHDAVFLGAGLGATRKLSIPGEELEGVFDAISFIYDIRTKNHSEIQVGDKVGIIGLGMTAIDAATQSKRLGAEEVSIVYRRSSNEKPCTEKEYELAKSDGVLFIWLASPKEIVGEDGRVVKLMCNKMKLSEPDASGRLKPVKTGETFAFDVDMVIKATGQEPLVKLLDEFEISHSYGRIIVNQFGETNLEGVFAGGDCVNGGKEVVDAVEAGKLAAIGILRYLGGEK